MNSLLNQLCDWYHSNCDEDWEHEFGIKLETLDNPGWTLTIDLSWTTLESAPIPEVKDLRSDNDWIFVSEKTNQRGRVYSTAGGPHNLEEMIQRFLDWTDDALKKDKHDHPPHH